jgi:hypothetical protein
MTTTPPPDRAALAARVEELRAHVLTTDDGERGRVCHVDGYPSTMDCTCGCAHNRHVGHTVEDTHCMGYVGMPECTCTAFVPNPTDVARLWQEHCAMVRRLDVDHIAGYVPVLPRRVRERFAVAVIAGMMEVP